MEFLHFSALSLEALGERVPKVRGQVKGRFKVRFAGAIIAIRLEPARILVILTVATNRFHP